MKRDLPIPIPLPALIRSIAAAALLLSPYPISAMDSITVSADYAATPVNADMETSADPDSIRVFSPTMATQMQTGEFNLYARPEPLYRTPEAWAFQEYGNFGTEGSSGSADISIPIHTISHRDLRIPITLHYGGGGIKVAQEASWVGLGWDLPVGGCINVVAAGQADYLTRECQWSDYQELLGSKSADAFSLEADMHSFKVMQDIVKGMGERDFYCVNILGRSFIFFSDPSDGKPTILGADDEVYSISKTSVNGWKIKDALGFIYEFTEIERSMQDVAGMCLSAIYLTSIESPEGAYASFKYETSMVKGLPQGYQWYDACRSSVTGIGEIPKYGSGRSWGNTEITKPWLRSITTGNQTVTFDLGNRTDYSGAKRLDRITVTDINGETVAQYHFNYGTFANSTVGGSFPDTSAALASEAHNKERLKLLSVSTISLEKSDSLTHRFTYNEKHPLPLKTSAAIDFWGYYNGYENYNTNPDISDTRTLIPPVSDCTIGYSPALAPTAEALTMTGAYRFSNPETILSGTLSSITYPTGGKTVFTFEPHTFTSSPAFPLMKAGTARISYTVEDNNYPSTPLQPGPVVHRDLSFGNKANCILSVTFSAMKGKKLRDLLLSDARIILQPKASPVYRAVTIRLDSCRGVNLDGTSHTQSFLVSIEPLSYSFDAIMPANLAYGEGYVKATLHVPNYYGDHVESGGAGIRIKAIENYDTDGTLIGRRSFKYTTQGETTSGNLIVEATPIECRIKYLEYINPKDIYGEITGGVKSRLSVLRLNSSLGNIPAMTEVMARGNVAYSRVSETETDGNGNLIRTIVNDYNVFKAREIIPEMHILPTFGGGEIAKTTVSGADGKTLRTVEYQYEQKSARTIKCNIIAEDQYLRYVNELWTHEAPRYYVRVYPYYAYWRVLAKVSVSDHTPGGVIKSATSYSYNAANRMKSAEQTVTGGRGIRTEYTYPVDYNSLPYTQMVKDNCHILGVPVEIRKYELRDGVATEAGKFKIGYSCRPEKAVMLRITNIQESVKGGSYTTRESFTYSDDQSCLVGVTRDLATKRAYLWSYAGTCPVAVVDGATFNEVKAWVGSDLVRTLHNSKTAPDALLKQLRSKLESKDVTVSTFTHRPLIGVSSASAPNGGTTSYAYDSFNRLCKVSDNDGITRKVFTYDISSANGANITERTMLDSQGANSITSVTWHDGIGRPVQTVMTGINTSGQPVVSARDIGLSGNPVKEWLPFSVPAGTVKVNKRDVATMSEASLSDSHAYSESAYDALGRKIRTSTPGSAWHTASKGVSVILSTNAANSVRLYRADVGGSGVSQSGTWPARSLFSVKTVDEDGLTLETFTDGAGHTVLERRGGDNDTYFVYNDAGQLRFVLQPMYTDDPDLSLYAFEYRYDARGNVVYKYIPGGGATTYVHDSGRRVTFIQDARLKKRGLHRFFIYDRLGRQVIQGTSQSCSRSTLLNTAEYTGDPGGFMSTGYTVQDTARIREVTLEIVTYYDDYRFVNGLDSRLVKDSPVSADGMQTGAVVYNSDGGRAISALYYDIRGNVTSTKEITDFRSLRVTESSYSFTDRPLSTKTTENGIALLTQNMYDAKSGLLVSVYVTVNKSWQKVAAISYDHLGRVSSITRGGMAGKVSYSYNLHGKITGISGPGFSQTINYNTGPGKALYNGNVSSMLWTMGSSSTMRGYKYTYNGYNWLTLAEYGEGASLASNRNRYTEKFPAFNRNGSFTRMERNGLKADGTYGKVDDLEITYTGNRIATVLENAMVVTQTGSMDYPGGKDPDYPDDNYRDEFTYDEAGSLYRDISRMIRITEYDNFGNPLYLFISSKCNTRNTYSASGVKLKSVHDAGGSDMSGLMLTSVVKYEYHGPVIYRNGRVHMVLFDGGFATVDDGVATFHYYTCDYLGCNRAVVNASTGKTEQTVAYYPYGGVIADLGTGTAGQPFKFGGKELIAANGLNEYDFGARRYWQSMPHFTSIDPQCESFYWLSPYLYCANNPVNLVDPTGEKPTDEEALRMSAHIYGDLSDDILTGRWEKTPNDLGLNLRNDHGLKSAVYQRTDGNGNPVEYAYVFAGTEPEMADIFADIQQPFGQSRQHAAGVENSRKVVKKINKLKKKHNLENLDLTFIGHSLGGSHSALNSILTDYPAITFNASGVSIFTKIRHGSVSALFKSESNIKAFIMTTDMLNIIQDRYSLPKVNGVRHYVRPSDLNSIVNGHSISSMLKAFGINPDIYRIKK